MSPTLYTAKNNGGNDNGDSTTMANNRIGFGVVGRRYSVCEEGRNEHPLQSASPSPGFGLSWQLRVVTEICSESGYGVIDGVGGHTECLRDGICPESQDGDISSESESESGKVVGKGVPLQLLLILPCRQG